MTIQGNSRLAAGPLGPASTFTTRRRQKVASATAIIDACLTVLGEDIRPSIMNVVGAGGGFSESTLNRALYKPILKAAQRRHEAKLAGTWREGGVDDLAEMQLMLEKGHWVRPVTAEADHEAGDDAPVEEPGLTLEQAMAEIARLNATNSRQAAEIQRRDDQLYQAVGIAGQRRHTIERLRGVIRDQRREIESLTTEPWSPRERGNWDVDDDDEEE